MTDARIAKVTTAIAGTEFIMRRLRGEERLGRPFKYELDLSTEKDDVDIEKMLGKPLTAEIEIGDDKTRPFHGIVSHIAAMGRLGDYSHFHVTVRPWVWFLSRCSDNRIFQEMSAPDIIKKIFKDNGYSDVKDNLTETYLKRDYCVQYNETSFDFITRLMEEEGIYYFFTHEKSKHDLVLADSYSGHEPIADKKLPFRAPGTADTTLHHVYGWEWSKEIQSEVVELASYDFEKPKSDLKAVSKAEKGKHGQSGKERYEYGRLYVEKKVGDKLAKVRREAHMSGHAVVRGDSNCRTMICGGLFELQEYAVESQNAEYLLVDANYDITTNDLAQFGDVGEASFQVDFCAIESKKPYRLSRQTPKSLVNGPQTAVVVGKSGEEIWTDKHGRVKVQFHWDREGKKDENSSCWVRVAHASAGKTWGSFTLPRIGQEVIVDFLEGDPDQPIITGSVYNEDNKTPFTLPDNQTQSGVRTRSSKKGDGNTFNELRFEDKKDKEEIYFHAERDFNRVVENNDTLKIGQDKKTVEDGNQTIDIHNDRTVTLNEGNDTLKVEKGNQKVDVKKKIDIKAGDQLTITVGMSKLIMKKNGNITLQGKDILLKANNAITHKGTVKVEIKAVQVKINGSAQAEIKSAMTKVEGSAMLDLKGGAMAKLKGGITMIG